MGRWGGAHFSPNELHGRPSMKTIHAVFENGVFRPTEPVELPEKCQVEFEFRRIESSTPATLDDVYALLSQRFESGETDVAERHNEHQP